MFGSSIRKYDRIDAVWRDWVSESNAMGVYDAKDAMNDIDAIFKDNSDERL